MTDTKTPRGKKPETPKAPEATLTNANAQAFVKVCSKRVVKALEQMRLIRSCANKSNYSYTEEQAAKVVKTLRLEVDKIEQAFAGIKDETPEFSL